jgi:tyrosyl-tRNA synthetase
MLTIDDVLTRGVEQVLPTKESLANLMSKQKITLYQGFDPSAPSLHLGNLVGVMKLRQFQKLGHKVIFLIGDFTGMIGDPSGKSETRKSLTREQVTANYKNYKDQIKKVIDFDGDNPAEVKFNSTWLDKMSFKDVLELSSLLTYQQVKERDMFQKREKEGRDIYLSEFMYPLMQGYDSVHMNVDLEVGGNDQLFNMMIGRDLMHKIKRKDKYVLTTKLIIDKDGQKVGKTTGNALFLSSGPTAFYGGIMSFPDEAIKLSFELLTETDLSGLDEKIKKDPMGEKKRLAYEIVRLVWSEKEANNAQKYFENTFQKRNAPEKTNEVVIDKGVKLVDALSIVTGSKSLAKRLIIQRAIDVNDKIAKDPFLVLNGGEVIKIGKKDFVKVVLK